MRGETFTNILFSITLPAEIVRTLTARVIKKHTCIKMEITRTKIVETYSSLRLLNFEKT